VSDLNKITEQKEMTIYFLVQILRLPGFSTEFYLNYDCSLNYTNLFKDLTKLLSKNAFSTPNSLSLSALLNINENIDLENSLSPYNSITTENLNQLVSASLSSIKSPLPFGYIATNRSQIKSTNNNNLTNNDNNGCKIYKSRQIFRLPSEVTFISIVIESFAKYWYSPNNNLFENDDSAFILSYAIIILNVNQHNHNVKKQSTPMILEEFKKNLSEVDSGANFEEDLLEELYTAIQTEEIVMLAKHTGVMRDNYLCKVLIRRVKTSEAEYVYAPADSFKHEIFRIVWKQSFSALSFVYDKSLELSVIQKSINGFKKCAHSIMIRDVFGNIFISLSKFTILTNQLNVSLSLS
jgi:Sec7-like guanine-nucleotide exchange factor